MTAAQQHKSDEVLARGIMFGHRNVSMRGYVGPYSVEPKGVTTFLVFPFSRHWLSRVSIHVSDGTTQTRLPKGMKFQTGIMSPVCTATGCIKIFTDVVC